METASPTADRRRIIADAARAELVRQATAAISPVDIEALATAIDAALAQEAHGDEGKRPEELNATNDD